LRQRGRGAAAWACAVCLVIGRSIPCLAGQTAANPRVRSSDRRLVDLIEKAARGSHTFRDLLARIESTAGIVYVEPGICRHGVPACLQIWMQVSGPTRFVRISIKPSTRSTEMETMSFIGHELQHAIEVLEVPTVVDGVTMFNFLKRTAPTDNNRFETAAAVDAGDAVFDELRQWSRMSH
jgi:hypothetical protein